jgi:hypothetical protein
MECPDCGFDNSEDAIFCGGCEKRLVSYPSQKVMDKEEDYYSYDSMGLRVSMSKGFFRFWMYLFVPAICVFWGLIFLGTGQTYTGFWFLIFGPTMALILKLSRDRGEGYRALVIFVLVFVAFGLLAVMTDYNHG